MCSVYICVQLHTIVHMSRGQKLIFCGFLHHSPFYSLIQDLSLNLKLSDFQVLQEFYFPSAVVKDTGPIPRFYWVLTMQTWVLMFVQLYTQKNLQSDSKLSSWGIGKHSSKHP